MALEKNDLKQIEKITRKVTGEIVTKEVGDLARITAKGFQEVHQEIDGLKKDVGGLKKDVGGLKKDVGGLQQDVWRIEKKLDAEADWRDRISSPKMKNHERRIIKIEQHLGLKSD